jgi:hypothetical protein
MLLAMLFINRQSVVPSVTQLLLDHLVMTKVSKVLLSLKKCKLVQKGTIFPLPKFFSPLKSMFLFSSFTGTTVTSTPVTQFAVVSYSFLDAKMTTHNTSSPVTAVTSSMVTYLSRVETICFGDQASHYRCVCLFSD